MGRGLYPIRVTICHCGLQGVKPGHLARRTFGLGRAGQVPHANQPREMLGHALAAEQQAVADYNVRIRQAEGFGDFGLKADLESQVADETRHKEELERIIAGWDDR